jgi:hypothetical protein
MLHVLINRFCHVLKELIHFITFMLHDAFGDAGCFVICVFEFMIVQAADFLGVFLADVAGVGKANTPLKCLTFSFAILPVSFQMSIVPM